MEATIKPLKTQVYTRNAIKRYKERIMQDEEKKEKMMKYMRDYYRQYYHDKIKTKKAAEKIKNDQLTK